MRIDVMGSAQVVAPGRGAVGTDLLARRQTRLALVALVLDRRRAVRSDELAQILWGESPPETWPIALRGVVSRVRQILTAAGAGPSAVRTVAGTYRVDLPRDTVVDLERAASDVERAEAGEPVVAERAAQAALETLSKPFLADCDGAWADLWRSQIRSLLGRAQLALVAALAARGATSAAVAAAEDAISREPLRETAHRMLMQVHTAAGDRAAALHAYERCRRVLADELGVAPSAAIEALYLELLGDESSTGSIGAALPFTGRARELGRLAEAWREARTGRQQLVIVGGQAGAGKSRFVAEFVDHVAATGIRVLRGRFGPEVEVADQAFAEALADEVLRGGADEVLALGPDAADLVSLWPGLADYVPGLAVSPSRSDGIHRWRLHRTLQRWLAGRSTNSGTVLVLDDLQWAVPRSLAALRSLVAHAADGPSRLLVIACCRVDEALHDREFADAFAQLLGRPGVVRIDLPPLEVDEVRELFEAHVTAPDGGAELTQLATRVARRTGGSPLLIGEVIRYLAASGVIAHGPAGERRLTAAVDERVIPRAVAELVGAQVAALGADAAHVIVMAALLGDGPVGLLVDVVGPSAEPALTQAAAAGLLRRRGRTYAFTHDLVRDAIVLQLAGTERAEAHRTLAEAIAARPDAPRHLAAIARHRCAAATLGEDERRAAVRAACAAGDDARAGKFFDEAALAYRRALGLLTDRDDLHLLCDVELKLGEALRQTGDPGYQDVLDAAATHACVLRDGRRIAAAVLAMDNWGFPATTVIRADRLIELAEAALATLPSGDTALEARLRTVLAVEGRWDRNRAAPYPAAVDAVGLAESSGDPDVIAAAVVGTVAVAPVDPPAARSRADRLAALASRSTSLALHCHAAVAAVNASIQLGDLARADVELTHLDIAARRFAAPYFRWLATAMRAGRQLLAGEFDEAEEQLGAAAAFGQASGIDGSLVAAVHAGALLFTRLDQGRADEAVSALEQLRRFGETPSYRASLAVALLEAGDVDGARRAFHAVARQDFVDIDDSELGVCALVNLARAAHGVGDADRARILSARLASYSGYLAWTSNLCLAPFDLALAWCSAAAGQRDTAAGYLERATRVAESAGAWPWLARSELERARLLDDPRAAERAVSWADKLGMASVAEAAARLS